MIRAPLRYYGGKAIHARWIVPVLEAIPHRRYVEPFAGGASILIAKATVEIEVYNDLSPCVANFFRVLADPGLFRQFERIVSALGVSRALWRDAVAALDDPPINMVDYAAAFFVVNRQAMAGRVGGHGCAGGWRHSITHTSGGIASSCRGWMSAVEGLEGLHRRLLQVQVESLDWRQCVDTYDTPETLFYVDPPYVRSTRQPNNRYVCEMSTAEHVALISRLQRIDGMAAISGYANDIYAALDVAGWTRIERLVKARAGRGPKPRERVECLWIKPRRDHDSVGHCPDHQGHQRDQCDSAAGIGRDGARAPR